MILYMVLPIEGLNVMLGNDLAGGRVWAGGFFFSPVVTSCPSVAEPDENAQRRVD